MTDKSAAETHPLIIDLFVVHSDTPVGHLFLRTREEARKVVRNWISSVIAVSSPRHWRVNPG